MSNPTNNEIELLRISEYGRSIAHLPDDEIVDALCAYEVEITEPESGHRSFELAPHEIEGASADELIAHLEARDRYRFGGIKDDQ